MRDFYLILAIILLSIVTGCRKESDLRKLENAYELMNKDSLRKAQDIIEELSESNKNQEANALYCLAKSRLLYMQWKEPKNDSLIDIAINYYKNIEPNNYYLCESYYYKGAILAVRNKSNIKEQQSSIKNFKEAENIATEINDVNTIHKIYEQLWIIYHKAGLDDLGKPYAQKALELAIQEKNDDWYVYATIYLASYYGNKNMNDSCQYFIDKCRPYLKAVNSKNQPQFLSTLALYIEDEDFAIECLQKSISLNPTCSSYNTLAKKYIKQNKYDKAYDLLEKGMKMASIHDSIDLIRNIIYIKEKEEDFQEACSLYGKLHDLVRKENKINVANDIMMYHDKYNMLKKEREFQKFIQTVTIISIIVIIGIILNLLNEIYRMIPIITIMLIIVTV